MSSRVFPSFFFSLLQPSRLAVQFQMQVDTWAACCARCSSHMLLLDAYSSGMSICQPISRGGLPRETTGRIPRHTPTSILAFWKINPPFSLSAFPSRPWLSPRLLEEPEYDIHLMVEWACSIHGDRIRGTHKNR